jgi:hypothetical protein
MNENDIKNLKAVFQGARAGANGDREILIELMKLEDKLFALLDDKGASEKED